jgi:exosortase
MSLPDSKRARGRRSRGSLRGSDPRQAIGCAGTSTAPPALAVTQSGWSARTRIVLGFTVLVAGAWVYWPTLMELVTAWEREPDYSHGYLVTPIAILFLWMRRGSFPGLGASSLAVGLSLLAVALLIRACDALFFLRFLDGYSLLPWLAAVVALLLGTRMLVWALPSIGFLFFMIPIPFSAETALSHPLQRIATKLSCTALQLLGQPAFAEGNTIQLGSHQLEIAQACSGLRLFVSVVALAYCYVVLVRRSWWEKLLLVAAVAPIAILTNSLRIVATGLLYEYSTSEIGRRFAHDFAGWAMIPVAAALFAAVLWYLARLFEEEEVVEMAALVRKLES